MGYALTRKSCTHPSILVWIADGCWPNVVSKPVTIRSIFVPAVHGRYLEISQIVTDQGVRRGTHASPTALVLPI